jgi:hypothetical protein
MDIDAFGAGPVTVRFSDPRSGEADVRYVRERLLASIPGRGRGRRPESTCGRGAPRIYW